jgi:hypothetical protein
VQNSTQAILMWMHHFFSIRCKITVQNGTLFDCFIHAIFLPYLKVKTGFEEYLIHRKLWDDRWTCYEKRSQCIAVEILQYKQKVWQKPTRIKSLNLRKFASKLGREGERGGKQSEWGEAEDATYQNFKKSIHFLKIKQDWSTEILYH